VLSLTDLAVPVVGAPMAGGPSTPGLAAAVSQAGGLGFLAAGYKTPEGVAAELAAARAATTGPLGLNLFVVEAYDADVAALDAYARRLRPEAERLGVELGRPRWEDDSWRAKLDLVHDLRPDVVSFTFGCPGPEVLRDLASAGVLTMVTVTTADEARAAVDLGAMSLAVQGNDAGGHRGTWDLDATPSTTPLLDLVAEVAAAVDVPLVAGGGLATAADVAAVTSRGAVAAQIGTAYLRSHEAGTNPLHRTALVDPAFEATTLTRAYTGRWARGLANRFTREHGDAPAGYPHLHHLTSPLRAAAAAAGDAQVAHLWAGTRHQEARPVPAAEVTAALAP